MQVKAQLAQLCLNLLPQHPLIQILLNQAVNHQVLKTEKNQLK